MTTTGTLLHEMRHVQHRALRYVLRTSSIIMAAAFTLMLTGCRKELCYDHDLHGLNVRVHTVAEWEQEWMRWYGEEEDLDSMLGHRSLTEEFLADLVPEPGGGIASVAYHESGTIHQRHIKADGGLLYLQEGMHDILFYNNDTEYIVFTSLDSYAEARATTRTRTRASFSELHPEAESVNEPDMLYGAWIENYEGILSPDTDTIGIQLRPLVYTYVILFEVESGIELVYSARGALSGMAGTVYMQDGHTGDDKVSVLFDKAVVDTANSTIIATVRTFGVPGFDYSYGYGDSGDTVYEEDNFAVSLEISLATGAYAFPDDFFVSDQIHSQPRGGVIKVQVPAIKPDGDGMFEVDVGDWEDSEEIQLPLTGPQCQDSQQDG